MVGQVAWEWPSTMLNEGAKGAPHRCGQATLLRTNAFRPGTLSDAIRTMEAASEPGVQRLVDEAWGVLISNLFQAVQLLDNSVFFCDR